MSEPKPGTREWAEGVWGDFAAKWARGDADLDPVLGVILAAFAAGAEACAEVAERKFEWQRRRGGSAHEYGANVAASIREKCRLVAASARKGAEGE